MGWLASWAVVNSLASARSTSAWACGGASAGAAGCAKVATGQASSKRIGESLRTFVSLAGIGNLRIRVGIGLRFRVCGVLPF